MKARIVLVGLCALLAGCTKQCEPLRIYDVYAVPGDTPYLVELSVAFFGGVSPAFVEWETGDGHVLIGNPVEYNYGRTGQYIVSVRAGDACGNSVGEEFPLDVLEVGTSWLQHDFGCSDHPWREEPYYRAWLFADWLEVDSEP